MSFGDNLLNLHLQVKYQASVRRWLCPVCWYSLIDTERGLHCVFCGWHESPAPPRYFPRLPDTPTA